MIKGTGVDIIEISRIRKSVETWGDHFLERLFNPEEIAYAKAHTVPFQHYAGFCGKRGHVDEHLAAAFLG